MSDGILFHVPQIIRTYNVSGPIMTTTKIYSTLVNSQTTTPSGTSSDVSPIACFGFVVLILSTVIGNILVLLALFLDKRLHSPSFFLIANMALADLLLGISVLPFSSILELLNDRWIFGRAFCTTWLALDVLCCTASIIALMAVSIDRYLGVTRPLTYSTIMTIRRTIFLIIIVWAVSILTSVVPLFGLTDRGQNPNECKVNKNTFYTIFSSMISFYIPVIILLILYSRIYQVAKKQGKKLEDEKRRLYELDYLKAAEQVRQQREQQQQQQNQINGHSRKTSLPSNQLDNNNKNDVPSTPLMLDEQHSLDHSFTSTDGNPLKKIHSNCKIKNDDDDNTSHSGSSMVRLKKRTSRLLGKRLYSTIKRNSTLHSLHSHHYNHRMSANDELLLIKRKLHNLKREKKAFRTVGIILGVLLICWLPFFVTLPVISILKHHEIIKDEKAENTWFKITFWLGYCNSALNPFIYAFSNRAIRQAFRQVLFPRCFCCGFCRKKPSLERQNSRRQRNNSASLITETSLTGLKRNNSFTTDCVRATPKKENDRKTPPDVTAPEQTNSPGPAVSFADFLAETADENDHDDEVDKQSNSESNKKDVNPT